MTFTERFVDADGFRIRYLEAGSGEPVVVLHGGGGLRHYTSHDLMAEKRRVIIFEMPGFGATPANNRTQTMADMASTMAAAVAVLGIETYDLMATSFGTRVAVEWALQEPEGVRAVALISPPALRPEDASPAGPNGERPLTLYAHPDRVQQQETSSAEDTARTRTMTGRLMQWSRDSNLEERLAGIQQPALILHGTLDKMAPPHVGQAYTAAIPNSHLILVYDAAHECDADRPEAVIDTIDDFFSRQGGFLVNDRSGLVYR